MQFALNTLTSRLISAILKQMSGNLPLVAKSIRVTNYALELWETFYCHSDTVFVPAEYCEPVLIIDNLKSHFAHETVSNVAYF